MCLKNHYKNKVKVLKKCPICGDMFEIGRRRITCSEKCCLLRRQTEEYKEMQRIRSSEWYKRPEVKARKKSYAKSDKAKEYFAKLGKTKRRKEMKKATQKRCELAARIMQMAAIGDAIGESVKTQECQP